MLEKYSRRCCSEQLCGCKFQASLLFRLYCDTIIDLNQSDAEQQHADERNGQKYAVEAVSVLPRQQ